MKVAIIGSRSFNNYPFLVEKIFNQIDITKISLIISGGAKGADTLAEEFAKRFNIELKLFKPNWSLGRGAGVIRNKTIVENSDMVFAFWDGVSKGTKSSIDYAKKKGKKLFVIEY